MRYTHQKDCDSIAETETSFLPYGDPQCRSVSACSRSKFPINFPHRYFKKYLFKADSGRGKSQTNNHKEEKQVLFI